MKKYLIILSLIACVCATQVRYDGYQVYRVTPRTDSQAVALLEFREDNIDFNFWRDDIGINLPVEIMVSPEKTDYFLNFLHSQDLESEVYILNVQELIDNERPRVHARSFGWTDYYTLDEINEWLDQIQSEFPEVVTSVIGGRSFEGRDIKGVLISFSPNNTNRGVFLEAGIHSREWVSPATVTYITNEILRSQDPVVRAWAENYDWYIFPVFNPDGYVFSHTTNRMWRKTRVPYGACYGADPNRNWDYRWNTGGSSNNPCSDLYHGPFPFSEPSVATGAQYISSVQEKLLAYFAVHSFSQMLLLPFGHTTDHLANHAELLEVCLKGIDALAQRFGTQYVCGNIAETIYIATGSSLDWVKGVYGTRISYAYELRDLGRYGFLLPADQIIPNSLETLDSLVTILNEFEKL